MITKTTKPTDNQSTVIEGGGWWSIPHEQQIEILANLPEQDKWSFIVTRVSDSAWSLDLPAAETYGELLVDGTNVALDEHYEDIVGTAAVDGDTLLLTCSISPLPYTTTVLERIRNDETWKGSAFYQEAIFGNECFLCPFTTVLWGQIPQTIYLFLTPAKEVK